MLHFTAVKGKRDITERPAELVATRVFPEIKQGFELVAQSQDRSVSAELRRMIEKRVEEFEAEIAAAA
jgi:predicted DNA-binding protein